MPKNKKIIVGEFEFISRYMKPLTMGFSGALQLGDDIAIVPKDKKRDYVITLDTIVEDVHFVWQAKPEQIANKLLRTNLSDIASCGAVPKFYLMTGNLSKEMNQSWLKKFTDEVMKIQKKYEFSLLGGDTVRAKGDKFFSVTMIGEVPKRKALLRSGAKVGDDIYVSGKIGEAWVGLQLLQKKIKIPKNRQDFYINKHYSPEPQIALGRKLLNIANSCTDISDGLIKDLKNICEASGVSANIDAAKIPLALSSASFPRRRESKSLKLFIDQITAGDDYQLIFTAKPLYADKIAKLKCHKIGKIVAKAKKSEITVLDKDNKKIQIKRSGYEH
jgi:thiamine-monophosphate kinase